MNLHFNPPYSFFGPSLFLKNDRDDVSTVFTARCDECAHMIEELTIVPVKVCKFLLLIETLKKRGASLYMKQCSFP